MLNLKIKTDPKSVFEAYKKGTEFKNSLGEQGIYEQSKKNERFYVGDQWYGVNCGNDKPLVRRNIIKRIGEHKVSVLCSAPVAVNYSAEGVPNTIDLESEKKNIGNSFMNGEQPTGTPRAAEISVIMRAMSDYFDTTAERVKFTDVCYAIGRRAFISGTGLLYTYWDSNISTGLYADEQKTSPIKGDLMCESIHVENVVFGDPNNTDVQNQPFIIISRRRSCEDVRREARANGLPSKEVDKIVPDGAESYNANAGDRGEQEPTDSKRVTEYTMFYKEYDREGNYTVMAVRATEKAYVRKPWNLKLHLYPLAKFCWEHRDSCIYGDSEVTYLIPNQIAINRALTAAVWATMSAGMPKMLVNDDVISGPVTNNPGEIIRISGSSGDIAGAISYATPPAFGAVFQNLVNDIAGNTLSDSGANEAALGDIRPDNAAAIIQMREAALQPLQLKQNDFYSFIEDVARIWAEYWLNYYGKRNLKVIDKQGTWYVPFDGARYNNLFITAKIDVGAATLFSESVTIATLNNLRANGMISDMEYFERVPKGSIPDVTGLIESRKQQAAMPQVEGAPSPGVVPSMPQPEVGTVPQESATPALSEIEAVLKEKYPEAYAQLQQLTPEERQAVMNQMLNSQGKQDIAEEMSY